MNNLIEKFINSNYDIILEDLKCFINIASFETEAILDKPYGEGPYKALKFILEKGESFNLLSKNFENQAGTLQMGDFDKTIGILAHVDVVPAGDNWTYDAFNCQIVGDKIYGRGTLDDKGPIIACLYAMKFLKESQFVLKKNIKLILGTDEETLWKSINYYKTVDTMPDISITPDANFPVIYGEKGLLQFDAIGTFDKSANPCILSINGGDARNSVPSTCVTVLNISKDKHNLILELSNKYEHDNNVKILVSFEGEKTTISLKGISAHAATPEDGVNAISHSIMLVKNIFDTLEIKNEFIELYSKYIGHSYFGENLGLALHDEESGSLTCNVGGVQYLDEHILIKFDVRYPITSNHENVVQLAKNSVGKLNMVYEEIDSMLPVSFNTNSPLIKALIEVYQEETGDFESLPIIIGGATYARALPNTVAFGPVFPNEIELAHQPDEFITIPHLIQLIKIYIKAIIKLNDLQI